MQKKAGNSLKKIGPKLLSISCTLLILLFSFTASGENMNSSDEMNTDGKISTMLSSKIAETSATKKIPVIIILANQQVKYSVEGKSQIESDQKNLITFLDNEKSDNKVQEIKSIKLINAVAAEVTPEVLISLAERPDVWKIEPDEVISIAGQPELLPAEIKASATMQNITSANAWGVDKIEAPAVWKQGVSGDGIIVAVVDTGIDTIHPDLDDLDDNPNTKDPKVIGWIDYVNSNPSPYDDHGHGTHVAGIISGTGANGVHTGVAPGTKLIAAKIFNKDGYGYMSDIILAFEWSVNNKARIISFSGGESHQWAFTTAINNVVAAGVIPVIAAGNSGSGSYTIMCPGDEINSLTVGATDSSDNIASFSSRGPVTLDGQTYIKPDVSAPGVDVISTSPDGKYGYESGTSMATPYVSGTVALILEKNPALRPSEVKQKLESTAVDLGSAGKDNNYGSGRINAYKAVFPPEVPVVDFSATPISGNTPLEVSFTDASTCTSTSWLWDFGDGDTSTDQNPTHTYSIEGEYTVKLTVSNAVGTDTKTKTGYINVETAPQNPIADFFATPTSGNAPIEVSFTDNSTGSPTLWKWSFGDGTYSIEKNPTHIYSKAGKYTVSLTVKNTVGTDTETKISYINIGTVPLNLIAEFSAYPTSGKAPLKVQFTDKSKGSPTSWKWSFGDGTYSTTKSPIHTYSKAGKYTVSLTMKNAVRTDTETKTGYINVIVSPKAAFSASPRSGKVPLKVQFTDKSTGSPTSWKWSFGDGRYSTQKNPAHTYSKAGKYTVSLTVKNDAGSNTKAVSGYIVVSKSK